MKYKPVYRVRLSLVREGCARQLPEKIEDPEEAVVAVKRATRELQQAANEHVGVMFLDSRHRVVGHMIVAKGKLNSCSVMPRDVFTPALVSNSAAIILFHNHPSGDPEPSVDDQQLTSRMVKSGETLGVSVLDHVIIGNGKFVSLREKGWI